MKSKDDIAIIQLAIKDLIDCKYRESKCFGGNFYSICTNTKDFPNDYDYNIHNIFVCLDCKHRKPK